MIMIISKVVWDFSHVQGIFKNSNSSLEIISIAYLNWNSNNLNFKNSQNFGLTTIRSPRFYKNIWGTEIRKRIKRPEDTYLTYPSGPPGPVGSEAGPARQGQGRLQPLLSGRGVASMPAVAATSCSPQGLHVPFSTPGEGPRSPLPFPSLPCLPLALQLAFLAAAESTPERPRAKHAATGLHPPRRVVQKVEDHRIRRIPPPIGPEAPQSRCQLHRIAAGRRGV